MSETVHLDGREWRAETLRCYTENELRRDVRQALRARRIQHTLSDAAIAFNGDGKQVQRVDRDWPDLTAVCPGSGQLLAVELKRPINDDGLTYGQAVRLAELWEAGALILVARSVEAVEAILVTRKVPQATIDEVKARIAKGPTRKEIVRLAKRGRGRARA